MKANKKTDRPRIEVDRALIQCQGLLPDAGGLAVRYGPLMIEIHPTGLDDGYILAIYATGLADEEIVRSVEDRIEAEVQAAADRLSAHELVRLRAALRAVAP